MMSCKVKKCGEEKIANLNTCHKDNTKVSMVHLQSEFVAKNAKWGTKSQFEEKNKSR
jgi:hypothetical protein